MYTAYTQKHANLIKIRSQHLGAPLLCRSSDSDDDDDDTDDAAQMPLTISYTTLSLARQPLGARVSACVPFVAEAVQLLMIPAEAELY